MNLLMLLLLFPVIWPFIAKRIWNHKITWTELGLNIFGVVLLVTITYSAGKYGQTVDHEVWNGQITAKERIHDTYEQSYDCNCVESCSGSGSSRSCSTTCSTCYETHYTVEWTADTTAGRNITFDSKDSTWRSVYKSPDPASYVKCKVGEPAALEHRYTNYVQAVPRSLFNDDSNIAEQFAGNVPAYPRVHSFYKINRVLDVGSGLPAAFISQLNTKISESLRLLGPSKQANIIVILTGIDDPTYRYAVENAWLGGEKNDVVFFIGVDKDNKVTWTDTMTWALNSGNELFHVKTRDALKTVEMTPAAITETVSKLVAKHYDRPQMADYEYLADEIDPPTWALVLCLIFAFGGSIGLSILFQRTDVDFFRNSGYTMNRAKMRFNRSTTRFRNTSTNWRKKR